MGTLPGPQGSASSEPLGHLGLARLGWLARLWVWLAFLRILVDLGGFRWILASASFGLILIWFDLDLA